MAIHLLDGTTASINVSIETNPAGSASGTLDTIMCLFRTLGLRFSRQMNPPQVTFCSGGWSRPVLGLKMAEVALGGYMSIGSVFSNPKTLIDEDTATEFTATITKLDPEETFDPCTVTGDVFWNLDDNSIEARGGSARQLTGVFDVEPITSWVEDTD